MIFRVICSVAGRGDPGNWRPELIFVVQQELEMYDTYQRRVAECDEELQKHLRAFADTVLPPVEDRLERNCLSWHQSYLTAGRPRS